MRVGIERIGVYGGAACVGVEEIFQARNLNRERLANLMMTDKAVALPWEDAVTNAVNAARPVLDALTPLQRSRVEMVITATESGIDFGKSLSTYVHHYLGLSRACRLFEIKQACFGATAALMMAAAYVLAHPTNGPKVLVVASDTARSGGRLSYAEPSQGTGAVAFLVGGEPEFLELDWGAYGLCGYEVMDTCRPEPALETGDADLSLFSYLDCLERCFSEYQKRVEDAHIVKTFDALAFHTPFGGMVRGAHRKTLRRFGVVDAREIDRDFQLRVAAGLEYPRIVGNVYSASLYLALVSLVENARPESALRVGMYSYGSGCSSEFFSGLLGSEALSMATKRHTARQLEARVRLSVSEYDEVLNEAARVPFGIQELNWAPEREALYERAFARRGLLALRAIQKYHRVYDWS